MDRRKILYAIIKEIDKGNRSFTPESLGVDKQLFDDTIRMASREGYIIDVDYAEDQPIYGIAKVTMKGLDYLKENSNWATAYKTLKELRDWIKL